MSPFAKWSHIPNISNNAIVAMLLKPLEYEPPTMNLLKKTSVDRGMFSGPSTGPSFWIGSRNSMWFITTWSNQMGVSVSQDKVLKVLQRQWGNRGADIYHQAWAPGAPWPFWAQLIASPREVPPGLPTCCSSLENSPLWRHLPNALFYYLYGCEDVV